MQRKLDETISRQNFIAVFVHSTFTVRSQNDIYSVYNWLSHHLQKTKNVLHNEAVILNDIGGDPISHGLSN